MALRTISSIVGHDAAEDVCQQVIADLWRHGDRYDPALGELHQWVRVVARRRAIDHLRSQAARRRRESRFHELGLRTAPEPFEDHIDLRLQMAGSMSVLTPPQRTALTLMYFGGLTAAEISARENVPLGTVKSRLRDGLARLRRETEVGEHADATLVST